MSNQWNLGNLKTILRVTDPTVSATAPWIIGKQDYWTMSTYV